MKNIKAAIAAYTRPAPIVRPHHLVGANKMIHSVAAQQLQTEIKPQGWHRLVNKVLAAKF